MSKTVEVLGSRLCSRIYRTRVHTYLVMGRLSLINHPSPNISKSHESNGGEDRWTASPFLETCIPHIFFSLPKTTCAAWGPLAMEGHYRLILIWIRFFSFFFFSLAEIKGLVVWWMIMDFDS